MSLKESSDAQDDATKQKQSNSAIRDQLKENVETFTNTSISEEAVSVQVNHRIENIKDDTSTRRDEEVHGASHESPVSHWEEWQKPQDITSKEDLLLVIKEFMCRKDVQICRCGTMFMDKTSYLLHKNGFHKEDNVLACNQCDKVCSSQAELIVHLKDTACFPKDYISD